VVIVVTLPSSAFYERITGMSSARVFGSLTEEDAGSHCAWPGLWFK
jgi:hypothetical protein